jgi:hypothetical protein
MKLNCASNAKPFDRVIPFVLSLSKERTALWTDLSKSRPWFDKLTTNGSSLR